MGVVLHNRAFHCLVGIVVILSSFLIHHNSTFEIFKTHWREIQKEGDLENKVNPKQNSQENAVWVFGRLALGQSTIDHLSRFLNPVQSVFATCMIVGGGDLVEKTSPSTTPTRLSLFLLFALHETEKWTKNTIPMTTTPMKKKKKVR